MEYFFYCRDRPGSEALRSELIEAHWSFMDRYADAMIARGPTLSPDRTRATGSMHIVDLPDAEAVRTFAYEEPNYRAGVYEEDVFVRRWSNGLGRTMWDFEGEGPGFLILGHGKPEITAKRDALLDEHRRYLTSEPYRDRFIARGPLLSDDGTRWLGSAMIVQADDQSAVEAMLEREPYTRAGLYASVEVHAWQPGGRR